MKLSCSNIKKICYISGNGNPKKNPHILGNETF